MSKYVIALDFGTDSVRTLLVNACTGEELESSVQYYPRWRAGKYCDARVSRFRQHPLDFIETMEAGIRKLLAKAPSHVVDNITAISTDSTGSTPVAVNDKCIPLALLPDYAENPNAMFVLWKDHTANREADEINALCREWEVDYSKYSGGIYSPEWFWAKILHIVRTDEELSRQAFSWIEHCDWIPALLTGHSDPITLKRSRCAAGHKAMWNENFGGLPSDAFLTRLDKKLQGLRGRLYSKTYSSDEVVGTISANWAKRLGLPANLLIGVGGLDAHFGAVGAGIEPGTLVKVTGTSTCDMIVVSGDNNESSLVKGICGQVDGSILPGMLGMEAGQSAFGDVYNWFQELLLFPLKEMEGTGFSSESLLQLRERLLPVLSEKAALLPVTAEDNIALDWINGRRTPDADLTLRGALMGLHLGTDAPQLFKALVEATAFGARAIAERFREQDVPVNKVVALGGIARKSPYVMQTLANVLGMPIQVVKSDQACALGGAMFAATLSGIHTTVQLAQKSMHSGFEKAYNPEAEKVVVYNNLYKRYCQLGEPASI